MAFPVMRNARNALNYPVVKFDRGVLSRLPEHYKEFFNDWKYGPLTPVYYKPEESPFFMTEQGLLKRQWKDLPIPLTPTPAADYGLWGGEHPVFGYRQKKKDEPYLKWWFPTFIRTTVYSEILNKYLSVVVTQRTLDLINDFAGFDFYILKSSNADLHSNLAMKIKRKMYLALAYKNIPYDDEKTINQVFEKYQEFAVPAEEAEWFGLTLTEAVEKQKWLETLAEEKKQPLKQAYRQELLKKLRKMKEEKTLPQYSPEDDEFNKEKKPLLSRLNPFQRSPS
ncbi:unnamed protein product [Cyprideis torosa]|uniref:Large ribosomal subunit protein bL28m n=1 Tax=Cyprideis torosa TaxID=163714 RepID=A0A7R8WB71_9CRUS|nr:unnamed protein product [Cyprideis torosa]CAG0886136.1 unnamed protein product [Cyprideis torosa]